MAKGLTKGQSRSKPTAAPSRSGTNVTTSQLSTDTTDRDSVPSALQQTCLNLFRDTFNPGEGDRDTLQAVKGHLFNRDFATAFSKEEYLRVYASRWSPSRALGYLQVLEDIKAFLTSGVQTDREGRNESNLKVVFLGGASAEIAAFAGWLKLNQNNGEKPSRWNLGQAVLVDIADWNPVVDALYNAISNPPPISKYASASAKEANVPLLSRETLSASFLQYDLLNIDDTTVKGITGDADLVTLLFTLNELYAASVAKTQRLMSQLTACCRPGALLLVVDSPGSYSTVSINGAEKKYPMHWLLDHTLVGPASHQSNSEAANTKWEKILANDSHWFRLPSGLEYPIELENMRYQIHLYRRIEGTVEET